jgi:hypothetical protein
VKFLPSKIIAGLSGTMAEEMVKKSVVFILHLPIYIS